jgi:hypothetical protein
MYGTEAGFTAYAQERGYIVPAGDVGAALHRATTYIDGTYGARFLGIPTDGLVQVDAWPRTGVPGVASDAIPAKVEYAAYEAALAELKQTGSLSRTVDPSRLVKRQKVDTIEREFFEPGKDVAAVATPILTIIEGLLSPFLMVETSNLFLRSIGR